MIFLKGPGSISVKVPPYNLNKYYSNGQLYLQNKLDPKEPESIPDPDFIDPPQLFLCNSVGLPFWCSNCRSIKTQRAHHSSKLGHCIPKFDHYCLYIGTIIAQNNFTWFLCFVMCFEVLFIYIYVATFANSRSVLNYGSENTLHPAAIIMVACNGFFSLMLLALNFSFARVFKFNETSVDFLQIGKAKQYRFKLYSKRKSLRDFLFPTKLNRDQTYAQFINTQRYVNVEHPDQLNIRVVLPLPENQHPFNKGRWENFIDWFRKYDFQTAEEVVVHEETTFSNTFKSWVFQQVKAGEGHIFGSADITPVTV
ncbi:hypothetical protein OGAPHI_003268 [Ogataea philodendri]|uniref:Palmitoyltransferase n=1 Tax=Ogataea philodendri TaxID=1378263 RepID=A0A9P8P8C4_9ASCO|nr:uncharacterized protein OGAPHI_003268 [Ogataea philodendri]KAH3666819.1 hypothetical protein OGAPHI_003268 [Ogataea philodendri]